MIEHEEVMRVVFSGLTVAPVAYAIWMIRSH